MQEELEQRSVTLIVSTSKFTGRTLKSAISHFLSYTKHKVQEHKQAKKAVVPHGKQSVKDLVGQDAGVNTAALEDDADIRAFNRVARKYGVDYGQFHGAAEDSQKSMDTAHKDPVESLSGYGGQRLGECQREGAAAGGSSHHQGFNRRNAGNS